MADQDNCVTLAGEFDGLQVDLGDERTSSVNNFEISCLGVLSRPRRYAMGAEDGAGTARYLFDFFHEYRSGFPEFLYHMLVVHDLLTDVNRRTIKVDGDFHHVNGD